MRPKHVKRTGGKGAENKIINIMTDSRVAIKAVRIHWCLYLYITKSLCNGYRVTRAFRDRKNRISSRGRVELCVCRFGKYTWNSLSELKKYDKGVTDIIAREAKEELSKAEAVFYVRRATKLTNQRNFYKCAERKCGRKWA